MQKYDHLFNFQVKNDFFFEKEDTIFLIAQSYNKNGYFYI